MSLRPQVRIETPETISFQALLFGCVQQWRGSATGGSPARAARLGPAPAGRPHSGISVPQPAVLASIRSERCLAKHWLAASGAVPARAAGGGTQVLMTHWLVANFKICWHTYQNATLQRPVLERRSLLDVQILYAMCQCLHG